jgi:DNA-binding Lrp family transcriptional regulator
MAHVAFLLVTLDGNTPMEIAREIEKIDGVNEAHPTLGDFDVIAVLRAERTRDVPLVTQAIHKLHGVARVVACVSVQADAAGA